MIFSKFLKNRCTFPHSLAEITPLDGAGPYTRANCIIYIFLVSKMGNLYQVLIFLLIQNFLTCHADMSCKGLDGRDVDW